MTTGQYNRRNFLSSIAILSAGTALGSGIKYFTPPGVAYLNDLQKKWMEFWKRSGGQVFHGMINHDIINYNKETKGHFYKYGQVIYFPAENILARPTWIFWNNSAKPADVVINLIENNPSFKKVTALNRFELDALCTLSKNACSEQLLSASFNSGKTVTGTSTIKARTHIKRTSGIQDIGYYKRQLLVFEDKIIYNA